MRSAGRRIGPCLLNVVAPPLVQERKASYPTVWVEIVNNGGVLKSEGADAEAAARLLGHPRDIDFAPVEIAVQFSRRAATGRSCEVVGGLKLRVGYAQLTLSLPGARTWLDEDSPLLDDDNKLLPGWQFCVTPLDQSAWSLEQVSAPGTQWRIYLDALAQSLLQ